MCCLTHEFLHHAQVTVFQVDYGLERRVAAAYQAMTFTTSEMGSGVRVGAVSVYLLPSVTKLINAASCWHCKEAW